ncbi:MAG: hypothetical protein ACERKO_13475, partial [Acetanaerobacterium sp.]
MALKKLSVEVGMNTAGFQRGLRTMQSGTSTLNSGMRSMQGGLKGVTTGMFSFVKSGLALAGITAGLAGITAGLRALEKAFVSLESSVLRVNSLFGDSSKYIQYFAENTAKTLGMSENAAYSYAATYGNLFRVITVDSRENAKVTIAMLKASAVIASKTGRTMEDVMERIRSGLLGNTEAIEDLGIYAYVGAIEMTDAFKKIANGRSWNQLTYYEQQQIRTLSILEQTHEQFGDEVQQGSAFALQTLSGAFSDLTNTAGAFVNAGLQPIIRGLTQLVQSATMGLKSLVALFGLELKFNDTSGTAAQIDAQNNLTDAVEAT